VVELGVLHHYDGGGESVVYAAVLPESIQLVAKDAVSFCVLRSCIFDECSPKFKEDAHEGYGAVVV
jgi:hypothetical protein